MKLMDLFELLKVVFVDVATEELKISGSASSASRVSVMSGVHRKDATRIMKSDQPVREPQDLISRIIGQWNSDPRFCTAKGHGRTLSSDGTDSEFAHLVRAVSADVAPYTVLYEMERSGQVERTKFGVKLSSQIFLVPKGDIEAGYTMLGEDLSDLIKAVEQNVVDNGSVRNLHLKTEFTSVDRKVVPEIRSWLLQEGSAFHKRVEQYLANYDCDIHSERKRPSQVTRVAYASFSVIDEAMPIRGNRS